jgi:hypothetical protein
MDGKLINIRGRVLELSLEISSLHLEKKDAPRETMIRTVLDFHFTQEEDKSFPRRLENRRGATVEIESRKANQAR